MAQTQQETRRRVGLCPLWKLLLHNDDVTPYEFVLQDICVRVFKLAPPLARSVTEEAHRRGVALVAVLPLEHAEFQAEQARSLARGRGYPLTVTYEPA